MLDYISGLHRSFNRNNYLIMKAIEKEVNADGHIILTCTKSYLFGLIKRKLRFIATNEYLKGFWNWRKLPNRSLVNDHTSIQLNSWCKTF